MQRLPSAIFQPVNEQRNVARKSSSLQIRLNYFLGLLILPIYHLSRMCGPCLRKDWPKIYHSLLHQIGNMWMPLGILYPKKTTKASLSICRDVWQRLKSTMAGTLATECIIIRTPAEAIILIAISFYNILSVI